MSDYKIVTLNYTEQASLVIRASNLTEAEEIVWEEFSGIPDLKILSIEDAPDDVVEQLKLQNQDQEEEKVVLN